MSPPWHARHNSPLTIGSLHAQLRWFEQGFGRVVCFLFGPLYVTNNRGEVLCARCYRSRLNHPKRRFHL